MKTDILFFLESDITDDDITFLGGYLPDILNDRFKNCNYGIYYSIPENYDGKLKGYKNAFIRNGIDDLIFWKDVFLKTSSEHIIKIFMDSPFIDPVIINEMAGQHNSYLAEFTFSENLPSGISCEIISKELINSIPDPEKQTLQLGKVIRSNINQFDIELYYKDPDIRDKRISFRAGNRRDKLIMENIYNLSDAYPPYGELKNIINASPELLYIGPSYLEIELTGRCDLACIFCYRKTLAAEHNDMDIRIYKKILADMKYFNLPYNICFGGSGEPMMHPNFYEFLEITLTENLVTQVIVETNGLYADSNYSNFIKKHGNHKIKTIININGADNETYKSLHGNDYYNKVTENISFFRNMNASDELLHLQIMKINETEPLLDRYYDFWEKYKIPIILQKQNTYLSRIEDRRYSDLTPIERIPCWHILRDLYILSDGTITFCKQDVDAEFHSSNISNNSISGIWENRKNNFTDNYKGAFPDNPKCRDCDEWYTFNL